MATVGTNSYISLADFKAWADLRAYDYSSYTDAQIEAATVVSAVDYIDPTYKFKGVKLDDSQPMDLPTDEVAIADIENGAAQAAWQQLRGLLFVDDTTQSAGGEIKKEDKQIGTLQKSVEYIEGTAPTTTYNTAKIYDLLKPFLETGQSGFNILRVL